MFRDRVQKGAAVFLQLVLTDADDAEQRLLVHRFVA